MTRGHKMRQTTKQAIAEALRNLLNQRSIEKITVKDIVEECGVNRQTFYYHFYDVYDLMEWMIEEGWKEYEQKYPSEGLDWQDRVRQMFGYFYFNRIYILHAYNSENRTQYVQMIGRWLSPIIAKKIMSYPQAEKVPEEKRNFIRKVCVWICTNVFFEWIEEGMPDEKKANLEDYITLINGSIEIALERFRL